MEWLLGQCPWWRPGGSCLWHHHYCRLSAGKPSKQDNFLKVLKPERDNLGESVALGRTWGQTSNQWWLTPTPSTPIDWLARRWPRLSVSWADPWFIILSKSSKNWKTLLPTSLTLVTSAAVESKISSWDVNREQPRGSPLRGRFQEHRWFVLKLHLVWRAYEHHGALWSRRARVKQKQPSVWHLDESQHVNIVMKHHPDMGLALIQPSSSP